MLSLTNQSFCFTHAFSQEARQVFVLRCDFFDNVIVVNQWNVATILEQFRQFMFENDTFLIVHLNFESGWQICAFSLSSINVLFRQNHDKSAKNEAQI